MAIVAATTGCTSAPRQLPPREPPAARVPAIPLSTTPPPGGSGRVVFDGSDGPLRIAAEADPTFIPPGTGVPPTRSGELCASTPCFADLPVGRYHLYISSADRRFTHGDVDLLVVEPGLTYYRRAPGRYESPRWLSALPITLLVGATVALTSGIILAAGEDEGTRTPGYVLIGAGAGLGVWGSIEAYDASRAKQQQGATTLWKP